jgi:hypothetical protein
MSRTMETSILNMPHYWFQYRGETSVTLVRIVERHPWRGKVPHSVLLPNGIICHTCPLCVLKFCMPHVPSSTTLTTLQCAGIKASSLFSVEPGYLSQYSVWLWTGRPGDRGSIPGRCETIFLLAFVSRLVLGPTQPPVQWVSRVLSPSVKRGRGVTLTTNPNLAPRSWMSRDYTSSPPKRLHGV